jgi:hypothetical protein
MNVMYAFANVSIGSEIGVVVTVADDENPKKVILVALSPLPLRFNESVTSQM